MPFSRLPDEPVDPELVGQEFSDNEVRFMEETVRLAASALWKGADRADEILEGRLLLASAEHVARDRAMLIINAIRKRLGLGKKESGSGSTNNGTPQAANG